MKTLILYDSFNFPVSLLTGAVLTGKLPEHYTPGAIWDVLEQYTRRKQCQVNCYYLGTSGDGTRVIALSARSGKVIFHNLLTTFLETNQIPHEQYRLQEISTPADLFFLLGRLFLGLPLADRLGKRMVERYIKKIYPEFVNGVKLDCNCQISDN